MPQPSQRIALSAGARWTLHPVGRPACLPPTGIGTVPVRVTWTEVETAGTSWKQVVGVHC